ncbi:regucalcin-like [Elysia marginata]|uniref:Regucalcin n=1 Tax=Elysia marginata TaxID=1093978 RepID=A0AAV4IY35_9GAST|nr:regucalcin-like [Elysia marginata]
MSNPKIETLLPTVYATCGEGPHWDVASQSLYSVDIQEGTALRWEADTGKKSKIKLDGTVSFVVPCDRGGVVVGHNRNISHVDWDTQATTVLGEVDKGTTNRLNDAKADASGRLWAGTMGLEAVPGQVAGPVGALYSMSHDHKLTNQLGNISISNGLDWTDDNSVMFYIDSVPRKVYAFDFDLAAGTISNQRTAIEFAPDSLSTYGLPDGMCLDAQGKIWVACFSASCVHCFDPETGKTLQTLKFPATNITSVCFGGKNLDELFVTSSQYNLQPSQGDQPLAGSLFRVTGLGVKGRAPYNYKG